MFRKSKLSEPFFFRFGTDFSLNRNRFRFGLVRFGTDCESIRKRFRFGSEPTSVRLEIAFGLVRNRFSVGWESISVRFGSDRFYSIRFGLLRIRYLRWC